MKKKRKSDTVDITYLAWVVIAVLVIAPFMWWHDHRRTYERGYNQAMDDVAKHMRTQGPPIEYVRIVHFDDDILKTAIADCTGTLTIIPHNYLACHD
jgi:hypothetical protein